MKFVVFKSPINGQFYFRIVARNGKIVATSEGYRRKRDAHRTAFRIRALAGKTPVLDETTSPVRKPTRAERAQLRLAMRQGF